MKKLFFPCFAALTVACFLTASARSAFAAPVEGGVPAPQNEKKIPRNAGQTAAPRADEGGQKKGLVRGREHEKAAKAAFELGVRYARAGRYEEAIEAFEEAVLYDPNHADARFSLGHALYDVGRWAKAAEEFKRASALNPKDFEAFNYLGAAYFKQGLYDQAIEAYKRAILLKPKLANVRHNIANAFYKLGRYEPAILYYREVNILKPRSAELFNDMGVAYAQWGRIEEATEAFKQATGYSSGDAYAQNNLALAYYLEGRYPEAAKAFERATRLAPQDADILRNAGLASGNFYSERAAIGDRVSLNVNARAGGVRRDMRWKERSEVIRGVEQSDAPERTETETRPLASAPPITQPTAPPIKNRTAPTFREAARRLSVPQPFPLPLALMTVDSPMVAAFGDDALDVAPKEETRPALTESSPTEVAVAAAVAAPAPRVAEPVLTSVYRVGVGDVLDIRLLDGRTNNSSLYTVLAGGLLEYTPLGDPFAVAGKTADEIAAHIKSELRRRAIQDDPQVVVSVREYASHTVIVSGLVNEPGAKTLRREAVPLYVIIADAQPLPEAGRVLVMSYAGGQKTEIALDDQAAMSALIGPGDIINVLGKQQQFYYIGGKVTASGQKEFHAGITLTQAILAAGGALNEGKVALVTRQNAEGLLSPSKHNLREIMSGSAPDPALQPGDRIEVIR